MERRTVLVLGGGGFAGAAVLRVLAERGFVTSAPRRAELNLTDEQAISAFVRAGRPDAVVNLAAAPPSAAQPVLRAVNVRAAEAIARAAEAAGARLVHVASDAGHDGLASPYDDDAPMHPLTPYGRSKADGEARVLAACPAAVSVRTSLLWDPDAMDRGTATFAAQLSAGERCPAFIDEIRCPLPRGVLAVCLADLIDVPYAGSLNVAGREPVSRRDFAVLLLAHFGVPGVENVQPVRAADLEAAGAPPRPRDIRLDVARAEALLGRRMPGVRELLSAPTG